MTGRSSQWFMREPEDWVRSPQAMLMLRDFDLQVVPYRMNGDAYRLSAQGMSSTDINRSLELGRHGKGVDGFVRTVANGLITGHEVWLEITFGDDEQGHPFFRVFPVYGVKQESSGRLVQRVPGRNRPSLPESDQSIQTVEIELNSERIIGVSLPDDYPSNLMTEVVNGLAGAGTSFDLLPNWVKEQMAGQRRDAPHYDSAAVIRTERLRIIQAASPIGWTAREIYFGDGRHLGDYYYYWRELRFLHFTSSLRACAEKMLLRVLTLAGTRCGFTTQVTAVGLYLPSEVEALISRFEAGEIAFTSINEIIFENADSPFADERQVV